jgi:hypothetical protein
MKLALVNNNRVENIIEADLSFASLLGYEQIFEVIGSEMGIGWIYDGQNFMDPTIKDKTKSKPLTKFQFISRLTMGERLAIYPGMGYNGYLSGSVTGWRKTERIRHRPLERPEYGRFKQLRI